VAKTLSIFSNFPKIEQMNFLRMRSETAYSPREIDFARARANRARFPGRQYDPEVGRWLSRDPILFRGGDTNLFGYVANDPVNWTDSSGLDRRVCSRRIRNTPFAVGRVRHDFVEFKDKKGNVTTKSFGPHGAIKDEDPNSSENSCPAYTSSSDQADAAAEQYADKQAEKPYDLLDYNCQDYSTDVFNYQLQ
jgi:RHS repeat-associated protein